MKAQEIEQHLKANLDIVFSFQFVPVHYFPLLLATNHELLSSYLVYTKPLSHNENPIVIQKRREDLSMKIKRHGSLLFTG